MVCETFIQPSSAWHTTDPRARILAGTLLALVLALSNAPSSLALGLVFGLALVLVARLDARAVGRRLLTVNVFMVLVVATLPFSVSGQVLWQWGVMTLTREGVIRALAIAVKGNAIVLVLTVCFSTMELVQLGHALRRLGVPAKLAGMFLFSVRYLDVLHHEYHRLVTAMRARAFRARLDRHTMQTIGYLIGMLFVRTAHRAEHISSAMRCRGFTGVFHPLDSLVWRRRDTVLLVVVGVLAVVLTGLEWRL